MISRIKKLYKALFVCFKNYLIAMSTTERRKQLAQFKFLLVYTFLQLFNIYTIIEYISIHVYVCNKNKME